MQKTDIKNWNFDTEPKTRNLSHKNGKPWPKIYEKDRWLKNRAGQFYKKLTIISYWRISKKLKMFVQQFL